MIETATVDIDEACGRRLQIAIEPGTYAMLAISDTGCGMTPEVQSHLFESSPIYPRRR